MEIPALLTHTFSSASSLLEFISSDPLVRTIQFSLIGGSGLLVYLIFWSTRDILARSQSIIVQLSCIILVAALPVVGILLYFLIRPAQTTFQRNLAKTLDEVRALLTERGSELEKVKNAAEIKTLQFASKKVQDANARITQPQS